MGELAQHLGGVAAGWKSERQAQRRLGAVGHGLDGQIGQGREQVTARAGRFTPERAQHGFVEPQLCGQALLERERSVAGRANLRAEHGTGEVQVTGGKARLLFAQVFDAEQGARALEPHDLTQDQVLSAQREPRGEVAVEQL